MQVTQSWFLLNPNNKAQNNLTEYNKIKWYVPFTHTTKEEVDFDFYKKPNWLKPTDNECKKLIFYEYNTIFALLMIFLFIQVLINIPSNANAETWILANVKHAGFYRVNYNQENLNFLINQLDSDHLVIDTVSRAQLLDDSFSLGRAEKIEQTIFLDIFSKRRGPDAIYTSIQWFKFHSQFYIE